MYASSIGRRDADFSNRNLRTGLVGLATSGCYNDSPVGRRQEDWVSALYLCSLAVQLVLLGKNLERHDGHESAQLRGVRMLREAPDTDQFVLDAPRAPLGF